MPIRSPLTRHRIVDAAARVADRSGLTGVSMRSVGKELGVEAMSLYHHVAGKDALVDALVEWVFSQIYVVELDEPWRAEMTRRADSARHILSTHSWAVGVIESRRASGPALLAYHNAVLGCLRRNGFPLALAATAFSALDAYVSGFVLTEVNLPIRADESAEDFVESLEMNLGEYPYFAEMVSMHITGTDFDYGDEFTRGLALILDGLERQL